jgi:hypothetical protein
MAIYNMGEEFSVDGVPIRGGGSQRFTGWWGKSYFVDYDNGNNGDNGLSTGKAKKDLQRALNLMAINDVVYVRNREQDITSTDGETILPESTANWSVAEAQTHISIIGASNVSHIPYQGGGYSVILKGNGTSNTTAVMDVQGSFCLIENLGFHRGASTAGGLIALTGNSTSLRAVGAVVSNCLFRLYSNNSEAAIYNLDNWFSNIYSCDFHDCNVGVMYRGNNSTIRRNRLDSCIFRNQTAASVSANVLFSGSNGQDNTVANTDFLGEIPTATDHTSVATASFILANEAIQGTVSNCRFPRDTTEGTVGITANGLALVDIKQALWVGGDHAGGFVGA